MTRGAIRELYRPLSPAWEGRGGYARAILRPAASGARRANDGDEQQKDDTGLDMADRQAARLAAKDALPDIARDVLPDGDRREMAVRVRDETGRAILTEGLLFPKAFLIEAAQLGFRAIEAGPIGGRGLGFDEAQLRLRLRLRLVALRQVGNARHPRVQTEGIVRSDRAPQGRLGLGEVPHARSAAAWLGAATTEL